MDEEYANPQTKKKIFNEYIFQYILKKLTSNKLF